MGKHKILGNPEQGRTLPELLRRANEDTRINKIIEEQRQNNAAKYSEVAGFGPFETNQPIIALFDKNPNPKEFGDKGGVLAGYYSGHSKDVILITNQLYPGKLIGGNYSHPESVLKLTATDKFDNQRASVSLTGDTGLERFLFNHPKSIVEVLLSDTQRKEDARKLIGFIDSLPLEDDFGLFQLYSFKDENNKLHGLVKEIDYDRSILEVTVFEPDVSEDIFMRMKPNVPSLKVLVAIERNFNYKGFPGDLRLFERGIKRESHHTMPNALLALAYIVSNKTEKAEKIIGAIERQIGFIGGLVKNCLDCNFLQVGPNAALALDYLALGKKRKAAKLVEGIEKNMRFEDTTGLYHSDRSSPGQDTSDNALLAIAYSLLGKRKKASSFVENIEKHIGFRENTKFIWGGTDSNIVYASDNAALALAYFTCGQGEKGVALVDEMESEFGYDKKTGLFNSSPYSPKNSSLSIADNALFALALMAKEEYLKK